MSAPALEVQAAPSPSEALQKEASAEADLSRAPALRPVGTFRMRERTELLKAVQSLLGRLGGETDEVDVADVDVDKLDVLADIDELLEKRCVVDPLAYASWATVDGGGPELETRVIALFSRVADDLGKSMGSAS